MHRFFSQKLSTLLTCGLLIFFAAGCASKKAQKNDPWEQVAKIKAQITVPQFPDTTFNILDYGAVEGGKIENTEAFRKAITAAHQAGGGRVLVPNGTFLTGAIHLKSNVNLHLQNGATILFSREPEDYLPVVFTRWEGMELMNYSPFIYAYDKKNIAITGKGTLDGNASNEYWWPWKGQKEHGWKEGRPNQDKDRNLLHKMNANKVPPRE